MTEWIPWAAAGSAVALWLHSQRSNPTPPTAAQRRDESGAAVAAPAGQLPGRWVWPVARWRGRGPVVSSGFGPRGTGPTSHVHAGVDIMFRRLPTDIDLPPRTPGGSPGFVMPERALVVAAADASVWSARKTDRGWSIVLDHGPLKFATHYLHMSQVFVTPIEPGTTKQRVRAGEPLGIVGHDPMDSAKLRHLHFSLWSPGPKNPIDPTPSMRFWQVVDDPRSALVATAAPQGAARNGAFVYRPVGEPGSAYPEWVRALKGKSGVYLIRDADSHECLYVGSSTGRLYDTLTRHFQAWRRWKGFWRGQYGEGADPGFTYQRSSVEAAVRFTAPSHALEEEMKLIARMQPRDNKIGQLDTDEPVPF